MDNGDQHYCDQLGELIAEAHRDLVKLMQELRGNGGHVCSEVIDFQTRLNQKQQFNVSVEEFLEKADEIKALIRSG